MNIALIGGTGNISSDCCTELLNAKHTVYAITRGHKPVPPGVTALKADRNDSQALRSALDNITTDVVIDFLGFTPEDMQIDIDAFAGRTDQLIFISSATVYATPHRFIPITEEHPLGNAFSGYAQNKQSCEEFLRRQSAVPVTILRPSHTYSKKWLPNTVSSAGYTLVDRLERNLPVFVPGKGDTPWTLTSTTDFAKAIVGLVGNQSAIGETFHATSEEHLTWKEIYELTAEAAETGKPDIVEVPVDFICDKFPKLIANIRGDKSEPAVFDNSKIRSVVPSFECRKSIKAGITESINWMRTHPEDKIVREAVNNTFDEVIAAWHS